MATETNVQEIVHKLEEGKWVPWVKLAVIIGALLYVINLWFFRDAGFKGLSHPHAIDQAQIAREIAKGNGFTTKVIRPAAMWQYEKRKGTFPVEKTPDTFHAPLNPYINSVILRTVKKHWLMTTKDLVYPGDQVIAGGCVLFFLLAVTVNYFVARRLFDNRLALLGVAILLMCEVFWDFSMSGLPQMLMLFLFSLTSYCFVRAVEAKCDGTNSLFWNAGVGLGFGLLALTHGLTIWMFAGALLFVLLAFRPWGRDASVMLVIFLLCYTPWMVRNYKVCGSPVGLGWYTGLLNIKGSESQIMRSMELPLEGVSPRSYGPKIREQLIFQFSDLYRFLGTVLVAPLFFVALLHIFRNPHTSLMRWAILCLWLFAVFGMAVFGFADSGAATRANDLHVLFIPLMTFYGLAFVLVMWSRLELNYRLVRIGFNLIVVLTSSLPFINQFIVLIGPAQLPWNWPPYVPPYIAIMNTWTNDNEIIASDMPWAVAWYADRRSLWLPTTIKDFMMLNDYDQLKGGIVGMYLTPLTGNRPFLSEIMKGEYKDWSPFITRKVDVRDFPLKAVTAMPKDNECVFFSDRDRWTNRED